MLRKVFVFFIVAAVFVVGEIMISQIAQAECPAGYPVNCGSYCCPGGNTCTGGTCCPAGYPTLCGGLCCEAGDRCVDGICCPPGYTSTCGGQCCEAGSSCIDGLCCPSGYTISCGGQCCEDGSWCIDGLCCPSGYSVNCGDHCCEAGTVCTDDGGCCPEDYPVSCKGQCCEAGSECCEDGCCYDDKACEECGELLINSVAIGLNSSAMLRTYVWQARQNYANCIREISGGCQYVCGWQLYDNLPGCDSEDYNDAGHRACVETSLLGARLECQRQQGQ